MRVLGVATAAALLSACFIEPRAVASRPAPAESEARALYGAEFDAVTRTDALISETTERGGPGAERLDRAAAALGARDGVELAEILGRDCLSRGNLERFASARGLSVETARVYLVRRFGARFCQ
jgi:hypothetical protein